MIHPPWEVADILKIGCRSYFEKHLLPKHVRRTAYDLMRCRTAFLGGHQLKCNQCGHTSIAYNSCRNRHCPKCQYSKREQWILNREADLLPVKYFHVVFTLPSDLNPLAKANPAVFYNLLFKAAWYTIKNLAADPKWIGGNTGMIALLHTWGQNLSLHPHLHCLIPNGALLAQQQRWIYPRSQRFLFPVRVMSKMYRGAFLKFLATAYHAHSIGWSKASWAELHRKIKNASFNVFTKLPFGGPSQVVRYLGRYSHRVAITNHRILEVTQNLVVFKYRDYRDGKVKHLRLSPEQFTHRFLLHVLPKGFAKIRHFGIFSNRSKNKFLTQILHYFERRRKAPSTFSAITHLKQNLHIDIELCPSCMTGRMVRSIVIPPVRGDPSILFTKAPFPKPSQYSPTLISRPR